MNIIKPFTDLEGIICIKRKLIQIIWPGQSQDFGTSKDKKESRDMLKSTLDGMLQPLTLFKKKL